MGEPLRFRDDAVPDEPAVSLDAFLDQPDAASVRVEAGDDVRRLAPHLGRVRLVEVDFPKFRDGRGFSTARILREAGFTGEIKATGDVLVDLLYFMRRCGFDSFAPDKPIGQIPGDISAEQMDLVADLAERYSFDELRATHAQNLVLPHVRIADLHAVWQALREAGLADANLDLVTDIIACPGLDYCSLANARSIPLAQKIATRFADRDRQADLGELKIKISGCINACGHHHAGNIGILGVDRKGSESYQLLLGGSGDEDTSQAKIAGPGFDEEGIVDAIERAVEQYRTVREPGERFIDTYRRVGMDGFKEAIYGA